MQDSGFRREVGENCFLLCYYAASSCNYLPTFFIGFLTPEDGVDSLSRNVGKELQILAA
jgi:hypothetical protein